MPVDMNALFRDHGITIELSGDRGTGVPFSQALLDQLDLDDLNAKSRQRIVPGDMLTAVLKRDENGAFETDAAGRPKRTGGYLKLGAENELALMIPRADEPGEFTRIDARNTRYAATALIRLEREARHEVAANARAHAEAMEAYEAARGRGEPAEEPQLRVAKHDPEQFRRYAGFITAAEAVIGSELGNPFSTAEERRSELMASLSIRNEMRNTLTPEQVGLIAQAQSLKEQIARIAPDHPMAENAIVAPYNGDGEALQEGVSKVTEAGAGRFREGVMRGGPADALVPLLMATFTRTDPNQVQVAMISPQERRRFEQLMSRHENEEIAGSIRPRIEGIMGERMPGYTCAVRFFAHQGVDFMMINDIGGSFVYAADSAARTQELDVERLNRIPTEADVPTQEQIEELRATLATLTFDNGADVAFDYGDDPEEDVFEV
jgi:hypothetical protein